MKFLNGKFSFLIFIPILFGFFISIYSWDGVVYFFDRDNSRIPADSTNVFSFKNLKSRIKSHSNKKIIAEQTIISRSNNEITLNFKNIFVGEKKASVCKTYQNIELNFVALNVAVSGEPPTITLNTLCTEDSSNAEYISTITIPLDEIKSLPPSSKEPFLFEKSTFSFSNIEDEWPIDFRLKTVTFIDNNKDQKLSIEVFDTKPSIEFQL